MARLFPKERRSRQPYAIEPTSLPRSAKSCVASRERKDSVKPHTATTVGMPAFYPPTVHPPEEPLSPLPFLATFVRNPLRTESAVS